MLSWEVKGMSPAYIFIIILHKIFELYYVLSLYPIFYPTTNILIIFFYY